MNDHVWKKKTKQNITPINEKKITPDFQFPPINRKVQGKKIAETKMSEKEGELHATYEFKVTEIKTKEKRIA